MVLGNEYKGTKVEYIDVASSDDDKKRMRDLSGDPKALPPQIFNGDTYCGVRCDWCHAFTCRFSFTHTQDYTAFDDAIESDELESFLKLK